MEMLKNILDFMNSLKDFFVKFAKNEKEQNQSSKASIVAHDISVNGDSIIANNSHINSHNLTINGGNNTINTINNESCYNFSTHEIFYQKKKITISFRSSADEAFQRYSFENSLLPMRKLVDKMSVQFLEALKVSYNEIIIQQKKNRFQVPDGLLQERENLEGLTCFILFYNQYKNKVKKITIGKIIRFKKYQRLVSVLSAILLVCPVLFFGFFGEQFLLSCLNISSSFGVLLPLIFLLIAASPCMIQSWLTSDLSQIIIKEGKTWHACLNMIKNEDKNLSLSSFERNINKVFYFAAFFMLEKLPRYLAYIITALIVLFHVFSAFQNFSQPKLFI